MQKSKKMTSFVFVFKELMKTCLLKCIDNIPIPPVCSTKTTLFQSGLVYSVVPYLIIISRANTSIIQNNYDIFITSDDYFIKNENISDFFDK